MKRWRRTFITAMTIAVGLWPMALQADQTQNSTSYSINESQIGGIGDLNSASSNFKFSPSVDDGGSTLGDNFIGNSSSASYQTNSGFNTTAQPTLTFVVTNGTVNLSTLSQITASTATATFNVKNYSSSGYVVQIIGTAPTSGGHTLTTLASDTASSAGTEQFGINCVLNASPSAVGADPVQVPSSSFSYGVAGNGANSNYAQTGKYRYVSGETIASAPKSSGETDYTATFLANISNLTPGGTYKANMTLVATGTF